MEHKQTNDAAHDEHMTQLSHCYFERNSFRVTVIAGLIAIGCVWGGCYAVQWMVGL